MGLIKIFSWEKSGEKSGVSFASCGKACLLFERIICLNTGFTHDGVFNPQCFWQPESWAELLSSTGLEPSSKGLHFFCLRKAQPCGLLPRTQAAGRSLRVGLSSTSCPTPPQGQVRSCPLPGQPQQLPWAGAWGVLLKERTVTKGHRGAQTDLNQWSSGDEKRNKETASAPQPGDGKAQGHFPMAVPGTVAVIPSRLCILYKEWDTWACCHPRQWESCAPVKAWRSPYSSDMGHSDMLTTHLCSAGGSAVALWPSWIIFLRPASSCLGNHL